jgi:hypothetical protein
MGNCFGHVDTRARRRRFDLARRMLCNRAGSENQERKEVSKMKKTISLLSNLLLSSTLFWSVPVAANEIVEAEVASFPGYCHMKFPPMREATLSWERPKLNTDAQESIDLYGPCDYDATGAAEIRVQRRLLLRDLYGGGSDD